MRNQIVSQDELREEGGSPTHALFALEMLLCRGGWGDCYVHHESTLRLFFVCFVTWQQEIRLLTERNEAGDMVSYWCWETWENGYWRDIQLISKWSIYKFTFSMPLFCCLWTEQNWLARRFVNRQELPSRTADGSKPMWQRIPQFLQQVPLRISICPSFCSLSVLNFCIGLNWKAKSHFQEARKVAEVVEQEVSQHLIDQQKANEAAAWIPHSEPSKDLKKSLNLETWTGSWAETGGHGRVAWPGVFLQYSPMKEGYISTRRIMCEWWTMWFSQAEAPGRRCEEPSWGEVLQDALKT